LVVVLIAFIGSRFGQFPEHFGVGSYTHSPRFRPWKPETEGVTYGERWGFESAVAQRLVEEAATNPQRWLEIVEHLDRFPPPERGSAIDGLRELAASEGLGEAQREQLWGALDKMVRHHRSFPTADWSLPIDELDNIAAVTGAFKPRDPIRANTWLFDHHLPDVGEARADYHEQEARVEEAADNSVWRDDLLRRAG